MTKQHQNVCLIALSQRIPSTILLLKTPADAGGNGTHATTTHNSCCCPGLLECVHQELQKSSNLECLPRPWNLERLLTPTTSLAFRQTDGVSRIFCPNVTVPEMQQTLKNQPLRSSDHQKYARTTGQNSAIKLHALECDFVKKEAWCVQFILSTEEGVFVC